MNVLSVLVPVGLLSVVLYFGIPDTTDPPPATPKPVPAPTCGQNNNAKKIAAQFSLDKNQHHYTHLAADGSNPDMALITDGVIAAARFHDTGPIVYHPDGEHFAFIARHDSQMYLVEYESGALHPDIALPIDGAPDDQKWVCYTESGAYLVALARKNKTWFLLVHDEKTYSDIREIPLAGKPLGLELVARNGKGKEGFRYEIEMDGIRQEIRNWFQ